ncbi:hypothetical protein NL676_013920 [Syzygium grande]|nr:hypothetical protein NL676_013920 [Syzygium grande]
MKHGTALRLSTWGPGRAWPGQNYSPSPPLAKRVIVNLQVGEPARAKVRWVGSPTMTVALVARARPGKPLSHRGYNKV